MPRQFSLDACALNPTCTEKGETTDSHCTPDIYVSFYTRKPKKTDLPLKANVAPRFETSPVATRTKVMNNEYSGKDRGAKIEGERDGGTGGGSGQVGAGLQFTDVCFVTNTIGFGGGSIRLRLCESNVPSAHPAHGSPVQLEMPLSAPDCPRDAR